MALKQAEKKLNTAVKKKEDKSIQKMYAKNVLQARGGHERLMKHKTRLQDVQYSIDDLFTNVKMTKTMGNAASIMKKVNGLTNIKEITQITTSLQTNMNKMGIMGEMVEDAMDDMEDDTVGDDVAVDNLLNDIQDKVDPEKKKVRDGGLMNQEAESDNIDDMLNDLKN